MNYFKQVVVPTIISVGITALLYDQGLKILAKHIKRNQPVVRVVRFEGDDNPLESRIYGQISGSQYVVIEGFDRNENGKIEEVRANGRVINVADYELRDTLKMLEENKE